MKAKQNIKFDALGVSFGVFLVAFMASFIAGSILAPTSNSDALDVTVEADATHYTTISAPESVAINVGSASSTGTYKVQSEDLLIKTNSPKGYSLYLSMIGNDDKLYHSEDNTNYISAVSGTSSSPSALAANTWGFSMDDAVLSGNIAKYAAVPVKNKEALIQKTTSANTTGEDLNIYFGALVTDSIISGTYSNIVSYTVVADATDSATIAPSGQNSLNAGTEITITTPLYTNMEDIGTVIATIGGVACTDMTTSTATGVLVVKCKTPAKTAIGNYDVVVSVPKFNKSYTVKYEYKKTYTLSYNANTGTGVPASQTCITGVETDSCSVLIPSTIPTKSKYAFIGWGTSSSATTSVVLAGGSYTISGDTTLYALYRDTTAPYWTVTSDKSSVMTTGVVTFTISGTDGESSIANYNLAAENIKFYYGSTETYAVAKTLTYVGKTGNTVKYTLQVDMPRGEGALKVGIDGGTLTDEYDNESVEQVIGNVVNVSKNTTTKILVLASPGYERLDGVLGLYYRNVTAADWSSMTVAQMATGGYNVVIYDALCWGAESLDAVLSNHVNVITIGNDTTSAHSLVKTNLGSDYEVYSGVYTKVLNNGFTKYLPQTVEGSTDSESYIQFESSVTPIYTHVYDGTTYHGMGIYDNGTNRWLHVQQYYLVDTNTIAPAVEYVMRNLN